LLLVLCGAGKAIRVELAAEAMKFRLQRGQIQVEPGLQSEDRKIIAPRRGLNLAAMRAEEGGVVVTDRTGPAGNGNRGIEDLEHS
jgi:hypothetical protein